MGPPIGIGILGCGSIADTHARAIAAVPALRLVATCSRTLESAEKLAGQYGVRATSDLEEFFDLPSLDAVTICTPSGSHAELGEAAALVGKHVVVEKPIDVSLVRADALIAACDRADRRLAVSLQSRHLDAPRALKAAVDAGRLGRLVMASAYIKWYRSPQYYASAAWRGTLSLDGGGALINQAIHTVDLLRWMAGPVREVSAFADRLVHRGIEGEDTLVAAVRFASGACGVIEAATSVYPGFRRRIELTGTEGTAVLDGENITVWDLRDGSISPVARGPEVAGGASDPRAISAEGHRRVMADFAAAVAEGRPPLVDGRTGRESLEVVAMLYGSARGRATPPA